MPLLIALLALTAIAQPDQTSWMRPESFHLTIGMPRTAALEALSAWAPKPGQSPNEVVVDYSDSKAMTLEFRRDRLQSVRFELFVLLPKTKEAFAEQRAHLVASLGKPRKETSKVLIYDTALPNVMVVASDDPHSNQGKLGLGVLAVRYYDPR